MDFLEILRYLNKNNINNEQNLSDELFKKLMICDVHCKPYLAELSDSYHKGFRKEYENNQAINYILTRIFCNEIERILATNTLEINKDCIRIPAQSSAYAVTYVGSIKGMKKIIDLEPYHFDTFKEKLLIGLITKYCKDIIRNEKNKEELNKVIWLYAECIRKLEISKNIPTIIDQEFIDELKKLFLVDNNHCWSIVHKLIDRKLPRKIENDPYQDYIDKQSYKRSLKRNNNSK